MVYWGGGGCEVCWGGGGCEVCWEGCDGDWEGVRCAGKVRVC